MPYKDKEVGRAKSREHSREYRLNHKEEIKEYNKQYRSQHKEYYKDWGVKNRDKLRGYSRKHYYSHLESEKMRYQRTKTQKHAQQMKRYYSDDFFKLKLNMNRMLRRSLKNKGLSKNGNIFEILLGYTKEEMKSYLDANNKFVAYSEIDVDHKTPLSWFDFKSEKDQAFRNAWKLENLQFLPREENRIKGDYYCADVMLALSLIGR